MKTKIFDVQTPGKNGAGYRKMMRRIFDLCDQREDPRTVFVMSMKEPHEGSARR